MDLEFDFGDTTMLAHALLVVRNSSELPLYPVVLHVHVYEFFDRGPSSVLSHESTDFSMDLEHLADEQSLRDIIVNTLSYASYNDPCTRFFWEAELMYYLGNVGRMASEAGVQELDLTVEIQFRHLARWHRREEHEMAELFMDASDEEIEHGDSGGVPASSEASIEELEVVKYNGVGGEFEQNGCSICLEEYELEMEVTQMPCKHIFHGACLDQWLGKSHLCPFCRYEMCTCWS